MKRKTKLQRILLCSSFCVFCGRASASVAIMRTSISSGAGMAFPSSGPFLRGTAGMVRRFSNRMIGPMNETTRRRNLSSTLYTSNNSDNGNEMPHIGPVNQLNPQELHKRRSNILRANSKLSLAPMMEYTDKHFRHLVRLLSPKTLLYTEMVAANAIAHERDTTLSSLSTLSSSLPTSSQLSSMNSSLVDALDNPDLDTSYLLRFLGQGCNPEGPSILQLGGSDPEQLEIAAKTVYEFHQMQIRQQSSMNLSTTSPIYCDYTALNLNCGCPSPKVAGKGCFGAALMHDPYLVKDLTLAMHQGTEGSMPVTVKCRIGTDEGYSFSRDNYLSRSEEEEYQTLKRFIEIVASGGLVTDFQIHARIAVLNKSYSPADNRKVPPLRYHQVRRLAREFPELNISLNGGIETLEGVRQELLESGMVEGEGNLEGIMVGRGWVANPWGFAMADDVLYPEANRGDSCSNRRPKNRMEVLETYGHHADYEELMKDPIKVRRFITKAISHLFAGEHNAKRYRIALDEIAGLPKKLAKDPQKWKNQPPLSELIMTTAMRHLSEEVLYRSPEESYEKMIYDEEEARRKKHAVGTIWLNGAKSETASNAIGGGAEISVDEDKSSIGRNLVREWQQSRKGGEVTEIDIVNG